MKLNYDTLKDIENKLGDSWYILDVEKFRKNYQEFSKAFKVIYPFTQICYSYKTNYIPALCKVVDNEGGYAEVVSEMEYDLAIAIGVKPSKIIVNGPYKPAKALEKFLISGSIVNLDSYSEVILLKKNIKKYPEIVFYIGLRCNFEFSGIPTSRFGFDVEAEAFYEMIDELRNFKNIKLVNLHCHYPSRDLKLFEERVAKMLKLYKILHKNGEPISIDIGGGLGGKLDEFIKKQLNYDVADYQDYAGVIATRFKKEFANSKTKPFLFLEPGTALVADTMKFVCKVVEIKKIRNKYIAITSGSKINFQPLSSKLNLPIKVYSKNKMKRQFFDTIDISGYTCMENDYLYKNYSGELCVGDFIVFDNVGSYSIVFKPPFILFNIPIISLNSNKIDIIKEAETFEHIFQTYKIK